MNFRGKADRAIVDEKLGEGALAAVYAVRFENAGATGVRWALREVRFAVSIGDPHSVLGKDGQRSEHGSKLRIAGGSDRQPTPLLRVSTNLCNDGANEM